MGLHKVIGGRFGRALSGVPRWAKQVGAFAVGAATILGVVLQIDPFGGSSPTPVLNVHMERPEWAEQNVTLGSYLAFEHREAWRQGLMPQAGNASTTVSTGAAAHGDALLAGMRLAAYTRAPYEAAADSARPTATAGELRQSPPSSEAGEGGAGTETYTSTSSSDSGTSPSTEPSGTIGEPAGGGGPGLGQTSHPTSPTGKPGATGGQLDRPEQHRLENRLAVQDRVLTDPHLQPSRALLQACPGVGYGGCAPGISTTHVAEMRIVESRAESRHELEGLASGALTTGEPVDASLVPPLLTAGMSAYERARVLSMLGDAVNIEVHTRGWVGQRLWLTWTMYEKRDGFWNPSHHEYLIDRPEAYLVPMAAADEGILSFWFPIPSQPGDYQVRYFIRAPGSGDRLAPGRTPTF